MECSTDAPLGINSITYTYDNVPIVTIVCTSTDTSRYNISLVNDNDCYVISHANPFSGNQGPYSCSDNSGAKSAEALVILVGMYVT